MHTPVPSAVCTVTGVTDSNGSIPSPVATTTTVTRVFASNSTGSMILLDPAGVLTGTAPEELELKLVGSSRFVP